MWRARASAVPASPAWSEWASPGKAVGRTRRSRSQAAPERRGSARSWERAYRSSAAAPSIRLANVDHFGPARSGLASFPGEAAAFACDDRGRELFAERADEVFPAASVIKLPLVMALYADAARGEVDLDERMKVGERVDGTGVLRHMRDVEAACAPPPAALSVHSA